MGYREGFKATFVIGIYKGLASCLPGDLKHPKEIESFLSNTKRGECYLCEREIKKSEDLPDKSITEIEHCQKKHSRKILKVLQDYFNPLFSDHNINLDFLNLYI